MNGARDQSTGCDAIPNPWTARVLPAFDAHDMCDRTIAHSLNVASRSPLRRRVPDARASNQLFRVYATRIEHPTSKPPQAPSLTFPPSPSQPSSSPMACSSPS